VQMSIVGVLVFSFVFAMVFGTLAEYVVHRLMHSGKVLGKKHAKHHQAAHGQGWFGEFLDYFLPSLAILWAGFLFSIPAGIGFAIGGTIYAALAAYSHQIQHERPELTFWLPRPVHHLHHSHKMWNHNFGISVDFWDRVFGTYKRVEWNPEKRPFEYPLSSFVRIKWF